MSNIPPLGTLKEVFSRNKTFGANVTGDTFESYGIPGKKVVSIGTKIFGGRDLNVTPDFLRYGKSYNIYLAPKYFSSYGFYSS